MRTIEWVQTNATPPCFLAYHDGRPIGGIQLQPNKTEWRWTVYANGDRQAQSDKVETQEAAQAAVEAAVR